MTGYAHRPSDPLCAEYEPAYGITRTLRRLTQTKTCPICRVQGEQT